MKKKIDSFLLLFLLLNNSLINAQKGQELKIVYQPDSTIKLAITTTLDGKPIAPENFSTKTDVKLKLVNLGKTNLRLTEPNGNEVCTILTDTLIKASKCDEAYRLTILTNADTSIISIGTMNALKMQATVNDLVYQFLNDPVGTREQLIEYINYSNEASRAYLVQVGYKGYSHIQTSATARKGAQGGLNRAYIKRFNRVFKRKAKRQERGETNNVLLIEGDSWYNFPLPFKSDMTKMLKRRAKNTWTYSNSYGGDWLSTKVSEQVYMDHLKMLQPDFFFLGGGGNDIVQENLARQVVSGKKDNKYLFDHNYVEFQDTRKSDDVLALEEEIKQIGKQLQAIIKELKDLKKGSGELNATGKMEQLKMKEDEIKKLEVRLKEKMEELEKLVPRQKQKEDKQLNDEATKNQRYKDVESRYFVKSFPSEIGFETGKIDPEIEEGTEYLGKIFWTRLTLLELQYRMVLEQVTEFDPQVQMTVVSHGYDYPIPSKKLAFFFPQFKRALYNRIVGSGEALYLPLKMKNINNPEIQRKVMKAMIFFFNKTLILLAYEKKDCEDCDDKYNCYKYPHLVHLDNRGIVDEMMAENGHTIKQYRKYWFDELHPRKKVYNEIVPELLNIMENAEVNKDKRVHNTRDYYIKR